MKKVLTGGAASKDGRLKVNDRLVGIENVDLTKAPSNAAAMRAITNTLSRVATNAPSVKLTLARTIASSQVSLLASHHGMRFQESSGIAGIHRRDRRRRFDAVDDALDPAW